MKKQMTLRTLFLTILCASVVHANDDFLIEQIDQDTEQAEQTQDTYRACDVLTDFCSDHTASLTAFAVWCCYEAVAYCKGFRFSLINALQLSLLNKNMVAGVDSSKSEEQEESAESDKQSADNNVLIVAKNPAQTNLQCFYDILHIPQDADEDTIDKAFRKFARQHHPDKNSIGFELFKQMSQARDALRQKQDNNQSQEQRAIEHHNVPQKGCNKQEGRFTLLSLLQSSANQVSTGVDDTNRAIGTNQWPSWQYTEHSDNSTRCSE